MEKQRAPVLEMPHRAPEKPLVLRLELQVGRRREVIEIPVGSKRGPAEIIAIGKVAASAGDPQSDVPLVRIRRQLAEDERKDLLCRPEGVMNGDDAQPALPARRERSHFMKMFTIGPEDRIAVVKPAEADLDSAAAGRFGSAAELARLVQSWPMARLVGLWNDLPGVRPVRRFADRTTSGRPHLRALAQPGGVSAGTRKQEGGGRKASAVADSGRGNSR
jgi:hypothetical protein